MLRSFKYLAPQNGYDYNPALFLKSPHPIQWYGVVFYRTLPTRLLANRPTD